MDWTAAQIVRERRDGSRHPNDVARSRFPFCIVWTPLPPVTWIAPFVGHMGITDSRGVIYDFAGPYYIGVDNMAFGRPTRLLQLNPELVMERTGGKSAAEAWDAAVDSGCDVYSQRMHNILCDNCHSHVANCLNAMRYSGRGDWGMVNLAVWIFFSGNWVSWPRMAATWGPFLVLAAVVALAVGLSARR